MSATDCNGFRALVVDDDELSRDVASNVLHRLGAREVAEAESGQAAVDWADGDAGKLDLIMCDLRMPQMDGLETLEALARRTCPRVFVLASGTDQRTIRAAAGAAARIGAHRIRIVDKPVTVEKMKAIVDEMAAATAPEDKICDLRQIMPPDCATDLVRGLALGEFVPFFVPQVGAASGRVEGVEAVWHWHHPRYGILDARSFAAVAERVGLLDDLFLSVFTQAVARFAVWRSHNLLAGMAINVPPSTLSLRDLPQRLEAAARLHGETPRRITLEVAETAWLQDRGTAREVLARLRIRGFGLSIDDFGTGYSSVGQLLDAPFNQMKLNASLLEHALEDREQAVALQSYLSVASGLEMAVVAQGVKSEAGRRHATHLGCKLLQGSLISAPLPGDIVADWIAEASQV